MISNHPLLPHIIARSFHWKVVALPGLGEFVDTGKSMVSLPHFSYGQVSLASASTRVNKDEVMDFQAMMEQQARITGKSIEIRLPGATAQEQNHFNKVSSWLYLDESLTLSRGEQTGNLGRKIRRAQKHGLKVEKGGMELLSRFYDVYELRLHELGSAALPLFFFKEIILAYPDKTLKADARVYLVRKDDQIMGGAITLFYNNFAENAWFATLRKYQPLYASYLLHAAMIEDARHYGCQIYSFGRSTSGSGVHQFKQQWGARDVPLLWLHFPVRGKSLRDFPFLLDLWKRVPLWMARPINRYISQWIY
ncbi:MAG: peptidoglycan bridge formation glycyltransferase FemA/FemB family protein [Bacteroidales bacterium]